MPIQPAGKPMNTPVKTLSRKEGGSISDFTGVANFRAYGLLVIPHDHQPTPPPSTVQPFWRLANALKEFHGED